MASTKWAPGAFASGGWGTSAQTGFASGDITAINSLGAGSCVVASNAVANGTNLDQMGEVSISVVLGATAAGTASYFSVYLLPLNQDGTTYGDGVTAGVASATAPQPGYWVGNIPVRSGLAGGSTITGTTKPFVLPRGDFKLAIQNNTVAALSSSAAASVSLRTTIQSIA